MGPEVPESQIPILEQSTEKRSKNERASREARNRSTMKSYETAKEKRIYDEIKKFGGLKRAEADKKLKSISFLVLGNDGTRVFSQKNP